MLHMWVTILETKNLPTPIKCLLVLSIWWSQSFSMSCHWAIIPSSEEVFIACIKGGVFGINVSENLPYLNVTTHGRWLFPCDSVFKLAQKASVLEINARFMTTFESPSQVANLIVVLWPLFNLVMLELSELCLPKCKFLSIIYIFLHLIVLKSPATRCFPSELAITHMNSHLHSSKRLSTSTCTL